METSEKRVENSVGTRDPPVIQLHGPLQKTGVAGNNGTQRTKDLTSNGPTQCSAFGTAHQDKEMEPAVL